MIYALSFLFPCHNVNAENVTFYFRGEQRTWDDDETFTRVQLPDGGFLQTNKTTGLSTRYDQNLGQIGYSKSLDEFKADGIYPGSSVKLANSAKPKTVQVEAPLKQKQPKSAKEGIIANADSVKFRVDHSNDPIFPINVLGGVVPFGNQLHVVINGKDYPITNGGVGFTNAQLEDSLRVLEKIQTNAAKNSNGLMIINPNANWVTKNFFTAPHDENMVATSYVPDPSSKTDVMGNGADKGNPSAGVFNK